MDQPTIELASNTELAEELARRATFVGVLVYVEEEVKGDWPSRGNHVRVHRSAKLSSLDAARVLNQAAGALLCEAAKESEQRR
jgi:hypothetical protein